MFEVVLRDEKSIMVDSFEEAINRARSGKYVKDSIGYKYFTDGTGDGFRALKQSNEQFFYSSDGIYNQKKIELRHVLSNAKWIYYSFGIQESLDCLARVKEKRNSKELKIIPSKKRK